MDLVRGARRTGVDAEFLLWSGSAADGIAEAAASEDAAEPESLGGAANAVVADIAAPPRG